jgi:hypothetical protein
MRFFVMLSAAKHLALRDSQFACGSFSMTEKVTSRYLDRATEIMAHDSLCVLCALASEKGFSQGQKRIVSNVHEVAPAILA